MFTQKLGHGFQQGFSIEIATYFAAQPNRGASIDEVGNLHHMLSLTQSLGGHTTGVLQIELDFLPWLSQLQRPGLAPTILGNAACLAQNLPDGGLRMRQTRTSLFERWIAVEVVPDRLRPRNALQVLWRCDSDLQNALHDSGLGGNGGRWGVPRS
jgi:hypothetical protein